MFITDEIKYIGVNDNEIDLFEGQYKLGSGVSYNSYLISDESLAIMDSVDARFAPEWFSKIDAASCGKSQIILLFSIWSLTTPRVLRNLPRSIRQRK